MTTVPANEFILSETTMHPIRRFGVNEPTMLVIRNDVLIGYYCPIKSEFRPRPEWQTTYSQSLKADCGLIEEPA